MKAESRPRCGTCYGQGCVPAPWDDTDWLDCPYCHGEGFDPYWRGPQWALDYAAQHRPRYLGSDPLPNRAPTGLLNGSEGC
jgi:Rieske Fe-S protein